MKRAGRLVPAAIGKDNSESAFTQYAAWRQAPSLLRDMTLLPLNLVTLAASRVARESLRAHEHDTSSLTDWCGWEGPPQSLGQMRGASWPTPTLRIPLRPSLRIETRASCWHGSGARNLRGSSQQLPKWLCSSANSRSCCRMYVLLQERLKEMLVRCARLHVAGNCSTNCTDVVCLDLQKCPKKWPNIQKQRVQAVQLWAFWRSRWVLTALRALPVIDVLRTPEPHVSPALSCRATNMESPTLHPSSCRKEPTLI